MRILIQREAPSLDISASEFMFIPEAGRGIFAVAPVPASRRCEVFEALINGEEEYAIMWTQRDRHSFCCAGKISNPLSRYPGPLGLAGRLQPPRPFQDPAWRVFNLWQYRALLSTRLGSRLHRRGGGIKNLS